MSQFLTDAKASGTVPDVIAWHELQGSKDIAAHVSADRSLESGLGISPRPISIEEYATPSQMGIPGALVGYVAKFERAGVHDAELAFWNHDGTLGRHPHRHRRIAQRLVLALQVVRRHASWEHAHHHSPGADRHRRRRLAHR